MTNHMSDGEMLLMKAEEKLKGRTLLRWLSSGSKYEDAAEMLEKAANCFKLAKEWGKAGDTYKKVADCNLKLENTYEAAEAYVHAASCYKKISREQCISCLREAVILFEASGKINRAARSCKEIGESLEQGEEQKELEEAMDYFGKAADLFHAEDASTSENQCKQKIAHIAALLNQHVKAAKLFEEIAGYHVGNNLLRYGAKGILVNAGICHLCGGDMVRVQNALEHYEMLDPTFSGSRESKFLSDLAAAVKQESVEEFTAVVKDFDSMTPLDAWRTTLLLRVKEALKVKENEEDDLT